MTADTDPLIRPMSAALPKYEYWRKSDARSVDVATPHWA
jgi:hypothetical protein